MIEVSRRTRSGRKIEVEIVDSTQTPSTKSKFLVFRKSLDIRPSDSKELGQAEIAVGIPLAVGEKQSEAPIYNFFPTLTASPAPQLLLHATFLLTPDRNGLRVDDVSYHDALLSSLATLISQEVLPDMSRALGCHVLSYLKLTAEPAAHNAPLKRFWKTLKAEISAAQFVQTLGQQLVAPENASLWSHSFDQVVCRGNQGAPLDELVARDWQEGTFRSLLKSFGVASESW